MKNIEELRTKIDDIDGELSRLFVERMELCEEIGKIKAAENKPVEVSSREKEIIERVTSGKPEKFKKYIGLLYSEIFKLSKKYQSGKARQCDKSISASCKSVAPAGEALSEKNK